MSVVYRIGAQGPGVARLQRALADLGLYDGRIDGDFGGGTESAVKRFQRARGLDPDGVAGALTWAALFPNEPAPVAADLADAPLLDRCVALTGTFETGELPLGCYGCVSSNFDGQGLSYGVLQWNLGQGSLPPLFAQLDRRHPGLLDEVFQDRAAEWRLLMARPKSEQVRWARERQTERGRLAEPWLGLLKALGRRPECHVVQREAAVDRYNDALKLARSFGLTTERAAALCFDIVVQNGSVRSDTRRQIDADFAALPPAANPLAGEAARLAIVANRRADAASARWREDVRRRKLAIARGEGAVHGRHYDLASGYGLRLTPAAELT